MRPQGDLDHISLATRAVRPRISYWGRKKVVMGFPRAVIISLLALAKYTGGFAATEGVNVREFYIEWR